MGLKPQVEKMSQEEKIKILKLINSVNKSKTRIKKNLYPLEYVDDGWRIIFSASLPRYSFLKSGRTLLENAIVDFDNDGIYYWIPYAQPPSGVTTPAMRLMTVNDNE